MHPQADSTPDVTGISPSEGPPGTKITVRGHNFGIDLNDLVSVFVCAHDCTKSAHWVSNGKLICFIDSINIKGPEIGPIVITTKSGGRGVSMINFNLSFDRLKPLISSSIWIDEDYDGIIPGQQDSLEVDVKQVLCEPDPLGILPSNTFSSGTPLTNESLVQYTSKIVDQSFHPIRFLLDRHPNTKWENLQRGYEQLKRNLNLTSVSEVGNKGDYISKNVVVVINVMSDMYKLSRLVSRQRTHVSDDLKNKIQELMDDISSNFTQLSQTYSSLLSCMSFYNIYIKNLSAFQIPRNILKCIRVKGDYLAVIDSFSEFNNRSPDSDEKLSSVFQSIDSRIDDFIHHVVDNLSLMYPMNFHHILELLKKIEKLSNKTDYSILILKNHQIWISERLELSKQIFLKYLMQQRYFDEALINKQRFDFCEKISSHIRDFCRFFTREINFIENIIEYKNEELIKGIKIPSKKDQNMLRVIVVDEAYNHYIDIYISNLCIFLLHPWSVVSVSPIIQVDVFCSLTSFNCDQCVQVFNLLMKFAVTIKDSPVHALSKTVLAQKEEEKFSFTFLNQFCSKFTNLLFDCLSTLKNFYILKLGGLLAYKPSTYTLLYYNDEFWCQPLKIYSVIFEWWTTFKGIFTQIPYNKAFDCSLPTKFEQLYPHKFMLEIVKEQVEKYLSTTEILNVHSLISYYHYIDRIQIIVLEKLENTSLSGWANSPIEPMILVESLKSEFSDVQRCIKGTLLLRACELSLRPVLKILKSMYFTSTPSIPVNFYKLFLDCLISIRSDCLPFSASLYQNIIEATFEQFYLYLVKNINLGHLSNDIRIRLYENVYIIKKIASLFSYKIDLENYGRVLMEINKEAAGSKVEAKAEKITSQWCNAISILSSTQIK